MRKREDRDCNSSASVRMAVVPIWRRPKPGFPSPAPEMERKSTKRPICGGKASQPARLTAAQQSTTLSGEAERMESGRSADSLNLWRRLEARGRGQEAFLCSPSLFFCGFSPGLQLRTDMPNPKRGGREGLPSPVPPPAPSLCCLHLRRLTYVGRRSEFRRRVE